MANISSFLRNGSFIFSAIADCLLNAAGGAVSDALSVGGPSGAAATAIHVVGGGSRVPENTSLLLAGVPLPAGTAIEFPCGGIAGVCDIIHHDGIP